MPGIVFMIMASISHSIFMLSWTPNATQINVIFVMAIGFAVSSSIATGQVQGLYSARFPYNTIVSRLFRVLISICSILVTLLIYDVWKTAKKGLSAFNLFVTLGIVCGAFVSNSLSFQYKLYIFVCVCTFSLVTYMIFYARKVAKEAKVEPIYRLEIYKF